MPKLHIFATFNYDLLFYEKNRNYPGAGVHRGCFLP